MSYLYIDGTSRRRICRGLTDRYSPLIQKIQEVKAAMVVYNLSSQYVTNLEILETEGNELLNGCMDRKIVETQRLHFELVQFTVSHF